MTDRVQRPEVILWAIVPVIAVGLLNGLYENRLLTNHLGFYWLADFLHLVALPALAVWILSAIGGYEPTDYGFRSLFKDDGLIGVIGLTVFICFMYWLAYEPVKWLAHRLLWNTELEAPYATGLPELQPARFLVVFYVVLSAALVEEVVFRSLPWLYFSRKLSSPRLPYIVITTILFAAIHWEHGITNVVSTAALGLVAAILYAKIKNVWPFVIAHFMAGAWSHRWI